MAIFEVDAATNLLTFQQLQRLDVGLDSFDFQITEFDTPVIEDLEIDPIFEETVIAHVSWQSFGLPVQEKIQGFLRDSNTGELTTLTSTDVRFPARFGDYVDLAINSTNLYALTPTNVLVYRAGFPSFDSFLSGLPGGTSHSAVAGADRVVISDAFLHLIDTDQDRIATYHRPGGLSFLQEVENGVNGVGGLDAPIDFVESLDGTVAYAFGQNSNAISVFSLDGLGIQDQKLTNNAGGVTGFVRPIGGLIGLDGQSVIGATTGDGTIPGGLVTFNRLSGVGNELITRPERDLIDTLNVLDEPFPETTGEISTWSWIPHQFAASDFPTSVTPLLLEKVGDDWVITAVGSTTSLGDGFGIIDPIIENFGLVSGSPETSGRYFGWRTLVDVDEPASIAYTDNTTDNVVRLDLADDSLTVGGTFNGANAVDLARSYSVAADTIIEATSDAVRAEFTNIEAIRVGTGGGGDNLTVFEAPTSEVAQLTIDTGDGDDILIIEDHSATTNVMLGDGSDLAELRTTANGAITIDAGAAEDTINVIRVGNTTTTTLFGGDNADLFLVAGDNIPAGATTTIEGDDPTIMPGDVLRFDPGSVGAVLDQTGDMTAGSIGVSSLGTVNYSELEGFEVIAAPIITLPAAPTITEGDSLNLSVNVTPLGTNNTLDGPVLWQLNGGVFGAVTGPNLNLTWDELRDNHGINDGDETYELAVRATNLDGYTSTEVITLTVMDRAPTIDITASSSAAVNVPFSLTAVHSDEGDDSPRTWRIDWGDMTTDNYGAATSVTDTHVYSEPGVYTVTVSVVDEDSDPNDAAMTTHLVNVAVDPADLSAGGPYVIEEGGSLQLMASSVGTPTTVAWDLNDDGDFSDAVGLSPAAVDWATLDGLGVNDSTMGANDSLSFPIAVEMTFDNGQVLTASTLLDVVNADPVATLGNTASMSGVDEGALLGDVLVQFTGATDVASADVNAGFTYYYDYDNDGVFDEMNATGTGSVPAALMGDQGLVTVRGRVEDKDGGFTDYLTRFNVHEVLPSFSLAGASTAVEGQSYTLDLLNLFDPGTGDVLTGLEIDWDDGSPLESFDPTTTSFSHTFADNQPGATTIRVIATDADGSVEVTHDVSVSNVAPDLFGLAIAPVSGMSPIVEGDRIRLTGNLTDPGLLDTFELVVQWGDGSSDPVTLSEGTTGFELTHLYTGDDDFDIAVTVTDDDGDADTESTSVTVANAAPQLQLSLLSAEINENGEATLSGSIEDPGVQDVHTVVVDWKDGTAPETVTVTDRFFTATRTFTDDDPTGTALDLFSIEVTATDVADGTSIGTATADLTVLNQAPQVIAVVSDAFDLANAVLPGTPVSIEASFSDFGPDDTYDVLIEWGDGNVDTSATLSFDPVTLLGTVQASHTYAADGRYEVNVTLTDDDLGVSNAGAAFAVVATPGVNTAPTVDDQVFSVQENTVAGSSVGLVTGSDVDLGDTIAYSLDDSSVFTIDAMSGELTVADFATLDYEMISSYSLQVTVTDALGATDTATLTINLTDQNEFAPTLDPAAFALRPDAPNGTIVGQLTGTDFDGDDQLSFSLAPGSAFAVDPSTGIVTLIDHSLLDFVTTPRITVPATVTDQGGLVGNGWMVITPQVVDGDFNDDGVYDCADIDALVAEIAAGTNVGSFDLNADGCRGLSRPRCLAGRGGWREPWVGTRLPVG